MSPLGSDTVLTVYNNDDLEAMAMEEQDKKRLASASVASDLLQFVQASFEEAAEERRDSGVDDILMEALRRRKAEYPPDKKALYEKQGSSTIYVPLTEQKCNGAEAWMSDVLMPYGEKIWSLEPTPLPDLSEEVTESIVTTVMQEALARMASSGVMPTPEDVQQLAADMRTEVEEARTKEARRKADNMEKLIEDQLKESDWGRVFKDFLSNTVTFGTGVLKGPVVRRVPRLAWGKDSEPNVEYQEQPLVEAPSPLDIYPSPQATEVCDGYLIERQKLDPGELLRLVGLDHYQDKEIKALLKDRDDLTAGDTQELDSERADLEHKPHPEITTDRLVEVFEFWGPIPGKTLLGWGLKKVEEHVDYEVQVIWSGKHIIKVMPNPDPLSRRPYHKAVYKRTVGSFWGRGVPELMTSSQDRANAAVRSLVNNMSIASGPQAVVDISRLADGEDITHIFPWKIWQITNERNLTSKAIEWFQPASNAKELQEIFLQAVNDSELESGVPAYTLTGDATPGGGVGRTSSGLAMIMNASSRGIKEAFANIDLRAVGPLVDRMYVWNMLYSDDDEVKGDLQVVTRGATGMLLREIQLQKVSEFLDRTNNPTDLEIIGPDGRTRLLRAMSELLNLETKGVVPTDQELVKRQQEAQQAALSEQPIQEQQANLGGRNTLGSAQNTDLVGPAPVA